MDPYQFHTLTDLSSLKSPIKVIFHVQLKHAYYTIGKAPANHGCAILET
jgi:hypothetical protein